MVVFVLAVVLLWEEPIAVGWGTSIYFANKGLNHVVLPVLQPLPPSSLADCGGWGEKKRCMLTTTENRRG
jgi:hypothetical protein